MSSIRLIGYSLAIAVGVGAVFASAATAGAAFLPTTRFAINHVQHVDCAVGAHMARLAPAYLALLIPTIGVPWMLREKDVPPRRSRGPTEWAIAWPSPELSVTDRIWPPNEF